MKNDILRFLASCGTDGRREIITHIERHCNHLLYLVNEAICQIEADDIADALNLIPALESASVAAGFSDPPMRWEPNCEALFLRDPQTVGGPFTAPVSPRRTFVALGDVLTRPWPEDLIVNHLRSWCRYLQNGLAEIAAERARLGDDAKPPAPADLIKITDAAEAMGISDDTVRRRLKKAKVAEKKLDNLQAATLDEYKRAMIAPKDEVKYRQLERHYKGK